MGQNDGGGLLKLPGGERRRQVHSAVAVLRILTCDVAAVCGKAAVHQESFRAPPIKVRGLPRAPSLGRELDIITLASRRDEETKDSSTQDAFSDVWMLGRRRCRGRSALLNTCTSRLHWSGGEEKGAQIRAAVCGSWHVYTLSRKLAGLLQW
ncbi:hypothetical protein K505DRAFT_66251 [Melanomma pulvis-pyrius CBS 109.77]|uniref:Uncharacterized protein n=1 Tax=Melanomma pulvis-pyrius CBS 109.77 TaxID=1314802 RepID=A0A6A6X583_9PLEO|nr:hypothetical protein K505DRAFT_66251 [Melanomma pulvis-pyrius CBS 109.77]